MIYRRERFEEFLTDVEFSTFSAERGDVDEQMVLIHSYNYSAPFSQQLDGVAECYKECAKWGTPIFIRVYISDAANQEELTRQTIKSDCPISIIEQSPLDGSKIAVWLYLQSNVEMSRGGSGLYKLIHNGYSHLWSTSVAKPEIDGSFLQTEELLSRYVDQIESEECTLLNDTIRTWLFVQNVDVNYHGVVVGRNNIFDKEGLVADTHFITSTGIGGRVADYRVTTAMDAYSVKGLDKGQIQFLYAPTHLNSTYEYGVRFERGTAVHYGDRSHIFISGTASIDNRGDVLYIGDIKRQTLRMWENVEVLLSEADAAFDDIAQLTIYLRDFSDYTVVREMFDQRFPNTPKVFVLAPVCRPTWLIEMECIAIKESKNDYRKY